MTHRNLLVTILVVVLGSMTSSRAAPVPRSAPLANEPSEAVADAWRSFRPRFVPVDCWFAASEVPVIDGMVCGTVTVPEDRSNPQSRMIPLAVMTLPAKSQPAPSGALVWLDPGPGNASISAGRVRNASAGSLSSLRSEVDLVFFDQRGTGYSGRNFCRSIKDSWTYGVRLEPKGEALFIANMRRCLETARAKGVPINAYSSWHIALDARDIRLALGLDQWNAFGLATSTEIAQAMVQVDREGLRSVVLDGPVPTQRGLSRAASLNMDRALRALSGLCRQDARCAGMHGDFHQRVLAILDDYEREPLIIEGLNPEAATNGRLVFDDRIAANFLMFMIYSADSHSDLPVVLAALEDRDAGAINNYAQAWFQPPNGRDSQVTRYAIKCRNNSGGRDVSQAEIAKAQREASGIYRRLGLFRYADECAELPFGPTDPSVRATRSDVPALVADGKLNPVGTFEASQALAAGFSNGQMVLFPYGGVFPITNDLRGCGGDVLREFLAHPRAPLDIRCVQASQPPQFLIEYRRTSAPGRLLIGLSNGKYPMLPILLILSLAVPVLALPIIWVVRRLRRNSNSGTFAPLEELTSWIAATIGLAAIAHLAWTLLAWAKDHPAALPAAAPATVISSAVIAAVAALLAIGALGLAFRGTRKLERKTSLWRACWVALATACSLGWISKLI